MTLYAEVVVNRPIQRRVTSHAGTAPSFDEGGEGEGPQHVGATFHYSIPPEMQGGLSAGQVVEVPFRSGYLQGVVVSLCEKAPVEEPLPISRVVTPEPIMTREQLALARRMSHHYIAPISDCVYLFVPPSLRRKPRVVVEAVPGAPPPPDVDARGQAVLVYLEEHGPTPLGELNARVVDALARHRLVEKRVVLSRPPAVPKTGQQVEIIADEGEITAALPLLGRNSRRAEALQYLLDRVDAPPTLPHMLEAGLSESSTRALGEEGLLRISPARTLVALTMPAGAAKDALERDELRGEKQRELFARLVREGRPMERKECGFDTSVIRRLEEKGLVRRVEEPPVVSLVVDEDEAREAIVEMRGISTHLDVLGVLANEPEPVWVGWVYTGVEAPTRAVDAALKELASAGLIRLESARRWRDPLADMSFTLSSAPRFTPDQEKAWAEINREDDTTGRAFLLHGVTGSGKTEIYLKAVEQTLADGRGAIILVPEIALAAQTVQRFAARFPGKVAVWHSGLSAGERLDAWERVNSGKLPIVVGPRSALFAPVKNPGLVVVDEEHEATYKQERSPRYHARDVAIELGRLAGATVILGSATPDIVTFRRAERGELRLLTMPNRIMAHRKHLASQKNLRRRRVAAQPTGGYDQVLTLPLPPVEIVDMREELRQENRSIFSRSLQRGIGRAIEDGEQVILFLNRRGAATFVNCRDCGHVMRCPRCTSLLTYHDDRETLLCHLCGREEPQPKSCPNCGGERIRYFGLGTEKVESVIKEMFPGAQTLRWDLDTTRGRGSHAAFLRHFIEGKANVLIGTQMIAKGLDIPLVTLVGVISADTALYLPDFRAAERTFQLLTQVAGRAGRSPLGGRVVIQTYSPELMVIQAASEHDYAAFYESELEFRREQRYPPFGRLARLLYISSSEKKCREETQGMTDRLKRRVAAHGLPGIDLIGPAPCFYGRIRGKYRWQIVVRAPDPAGFLRPLEFPLGWRVDVDPVSLL